MPLVLVLDDLSPDPEEDEMDTERVGICGSMATLAPTGTSPLVCDLPSGHDGWHGADVPSTYGTASRTSWNFTEGTAAYVINSSEPYDTILEQRDAAITAANEARQLLLDAGVNTKPGDDLVNLAKTAGADLTWLTEAHTKACAARDAAITERDRLRERLAADHNELVRRRNEDLALRGLLSPNGQPPQVPVGLVGESVLPAVEWLLGQRRALTDLLDAAEAELKLARPIVEAAKAWSAHEGTEPDAPDANEANAWEVEDDSLAGALIAAVDALPPTPDGDQVSPSTDDEGAARPALDMGYMSLPLAVQQADGDGDPWRLAEWERLPNQCLIGGCDATETDERGPVFLRDGSMHKACVEHWEAITLVLGDQASWEKLDGAHGRTEGADAALKKLDDDELTQLRAKVSAVRPAGGPVASVRFTQTDDQQCTVVVGLQDGREWTYAGEAWSGLEFTWRNEPVEIPATNGYREYRKGPVLDLTANASLRGFTQTETTTDPLASLDPEVREVVDNTIREWEERRAT